MSNPAAATSSSIRFSSSSNTQVQDVTQLERIGAHSHIRGLGLNDSLEVLDSKNCGWIGHYKARKALGIVWKLLERGQHSSSSSSMSGILLAGPPSTGKTALAMALAHETQTPFTNLSASSIYSLEMSKTEALTQSIRKSMGVQIEEETEVIVGEVVEIQLDTDTRGQKSGKMILCTTDMETVYDLGSKMIGYLQTEKVQAGDIIQIDKGNQGKLTKLGRSVSKSREYDAISSTTKFLSSPEGELIQRKTTKHVVSLHEMDVINSRQQGFLALFAGDTGEIRPELRQQIDEKVQMWKEEGRATIVPGVLFIDEAHMLDMEGYSYLNRALEEDLSPILILATNRGLSNIRGTEYNSPHGIPLDLLDRLMIVSTVPYTKDELQQILQVRCIEEQVDMDDEALELLTRIALESSSLRYAVHLISVSHLLAKKQYKKGSNNNDNKKQRQQGVVMVELRHVQKVSQLFVDVQRSTERLMEANHRNDFMFNELTTTTTTATTKDMAAAAPAKETKNNNDATTTTTATADTEAMVEG